MKKLFYNDGRFIDLALLLIRVGFGGLFILHGYPKLFGGVEKWEAVGGAFAYLGVDFAPAFWGFMAGFAEFFGGVFLILGLFFNPACVLLLVTMVVATSMHIGAGDGITGASHALKSGIVFLSLLIAGPGKYSIDVKLFK